MAMTQTELALAGCGRANTELRRQLADAEADRDALSEGVVRLVLLSELCECPDMVDGGTPLPDCPTHGDPDLFVARVRHLREVERAAREVRGTLGSPDEHLTAVQRLGILLDGGA